jgi:hypothetical protein
MAQVQLEAAGVAELQAILAEVAERMARGDSRGDSGAT